MSSYSPESSFMTILSLGLGFVLFLSFFGLVAACDRL